MAKIMDIKGYWDPTYERNYNDQDMWEGKIFLEEDGWFEGIVVDPYSSYKEDRFIFGIYHPEKIIELYKFTPLDVSSPFVFHGKKKTEGYDGAFELIGLFGPTPYGSSRLITRDIVEENVELDSKELEAKISRYKKSIMDETGREFYNNSIAMRKSLSQIILREYEGRGFTNKEMESIMDEIGPIQERIIGEIEEEAMKLVRTMPDYDVDDTDGLWFDDDEELPFK